MTRISFELTLEEKERFATAMARVTEEMGDGAPTDLASTLVFLSQRILEGQPAFGSQAVHNVDGAAARPGASRGPAAPGLTVVYHQYADRASTVETPEGPVRIPPETVDRIADVAQVVTLKAEDVALAEPLPDGGIDRPNDPAIVRKRDGERCANPGCGTRKGLQALRLGAACAVRPRDSGVRARHVGSVCDLHLEAREPVQCPRPSERPLRGQILHQR